MATRFTYTNEYLAYLTPLKTLPRSSKTLSSAAFSAKAIIPYTGSSFPYKNFILFSEFVSQLFAIVVRYRQMNNFFGGKKVYKISD